MKIDLSFVSIPTVSKNPRLEAVANKQVTRIIGQNPPPSPEVHADTPFTDNQGVPISYRTEPGGMHQDVESPDHDNDDYWMDQEKVDRESWIEERRQAGETDKRLPARLIADSFTWDESQLEAINGLAKVQHGCMIGAAGTGKTTCEKKLVDTLIHGDPEFGVEPMDMAKVNLGTYWDRHAQLKDGERPESQHIVPSILLCSYTGQATQNIKKNFPPEWHGNIMTIHSALGYYPETYEYMDPSTNQIKQSMRFVPFYGKMFKMPWDVVIIDEASMANLDLWHQLLDASKATTRFYLIGDINQLPPPIGQGILGFAMSQWPVFELRHIHRQKEPAANRIIETAWGILNGKTPQFDDPKMNPDWRVIGFELKHDVATAAHQVVVLAEAMRKQRINVVTKNKDGQVVETPNYPIYDPWRDRILTCMNGYNPEDPASAIGQFPLNEILSQRFSAGAERILIDAGREIKRFAIGYRVMATKNESPTVQDRVTNGMTGIITDIIENADYTGDSRLFGKESVVKETRKALVDSAFDRTKNAEVDFSLEGVGEGLKVGEEKDERIRGAASHSVTVDFNGIIRVFRAKTEVEQLQIAYASTVHKTQGSEMDLAIIIVHHAQKKMLCRESLYTAVTRATKRLLILYTPHGMKIALAKQKIFGNTIEEKVRQYLALVQESLGPMAVRVRLTQED